MRAPILCLPLLFLSLSCTTRSVLNSTRHFPPNTGFLTRSLTLDGHEKKYALFIPRSYSPEKKYPAILFLHGLFESGSDGTRCLSAGLGPQIAKDPDHFPFIVIFPQTTGTWVGQRKERLALATFDAAQRDYSIDPDRVILAGLSYGGRGCYEIASRHPHRFAALVPVCGPSALDRIHHLTSLPIWAFHNTADPFVPSANSRKMVDRINSAGGRANLTLFPTLGHDCWPQAFSQSALLPWMLSQRRPPALATTTD